MPRSIVVCLLALLWAPHAWAQSRPASGSAAPQDQIPSGASIYARPKTSPRLETTEGRLLAPGDEVDANEALDEMLDELAADVARLGAARLTPMLLERVRVSDNMNPEFARVLEARLVAAVHRAANVQVMRCFECFATHAQVEDGSWVVRRGISRREDLQELARKYGAQMVLNVSLTLHSLPSSLALDVEMVRPEDASIVFAEGYRVHPYTAMLYRTADKAQSREVKLKELEDRLNARPTFTHATHLGAIFIPADGHPDGPVWGTYVAYRAAESFGDDRQLRAGVTLAGIINPMRMTAGVISGTFLGRVTPDNIYSVTCLMGGSAGFLITGGTGNTPVLAAQAECALAYRITFQGSLGYVVPFAAAPGVNYTIGGVSPQLGVGLSW